MAWDDYLAGFHRDRAGITDEVLRRSHDGAITPYEWLMAAVSDHAVVLDVACGSAPLWPMVVATIPGHGPLRHQSHRRHHRHLRRMRQPELDDVAEFVLIQPTLDRGHQRHRQPDLGAVVQRPLLDLPQILTPDLPVGALVQALHQM
ncbi:MAG: hypothetical protein ACRDSP_23990 [Pseudonocardiaceae bacterium]